MKKVMSEMFDQAAETLDLAIKNGVQMQEEASRWWSGILSTPSPWQAWQSTEIQTAPIVQKTMEEGLRVFDRSWRSSLDLMKKVFDAGQSAAALQLKAQQLWEASITTLRTEMQAMAEANARTMEMWGELARSSTEDATMAAGRMARVAREANGSSKPARSRRKKSR